LWYQHVIDKRPARQCLTSNVAFEGSLHVIELQKIVRYYPTSMACAKSQ
jgi:hypothetical protein